MSNDPPKPPEETVGYGKPPVKNRFKKGQSGNPAGRPRGAVNFASTLRNALLEKVIVKVNGRAKKTTKLETAFRSLADKAVDGDVHAARLLATLARSVEEPFERGPEPQADFDETDRNVLEPIFTQLNREASKG